MIRIDKSSTDVPTILEAGSKGETATQKLKLVHDSGEIQLKFDSKIYGHESVKSVLVSLQHDKCCFCEAQVSHTSHGDVEHFRPKGGYQQSENDPLEQPGYYWLAYDFSNLFFACQKCNEVYKRNYFPLVDTTKRAKSHNDDHEQEESLILHPEFDNPEDHITFDKEVVKPKNGSLKGRETIKRTGLDRLKLEDRRFDYFQLLLTLAKVARGNGSEAGEAQDHFKRLGQPTSLYSAMVRANFPDLV
ncbi:hypothetical protein BH09BAC4_BH09BAC4_35540 [soil metagenome]